MQSPDLIPSTSEVGSLTANSNDESQFVGSSSGVFFVNTVRRAFAQSLGSMKTAPTPEFPVPEDTLIGSPSSARANSNANRRQSKATVEPRTTWTYDPQIAQCLGEAPGLDDARQLMMTYFKIWHPLFPFLHGPSFLHAMEAFYSEGSAGDELSKAVSEHHRVCWSAIFQCIFNISSTLQPDLQLAQRAKITSAADALKLANVLLNRHDILSLQAILAIQLYLVASMSLRNASLLGGTILRAVLHAGFHRCPFRYQQLSAHDCQLRKRIFWCFYAIDRYLSQALGLPLGIQDSDIDAVIVFKMAY
uniref:Activator of stress genes 1 n=1 Tax=Talaromyces marneffei PM1 TaxID=1077442 RepID=A0A093UUM2_TALMA